MEEIDEFSQLHLNESFLRGFSSTKTYQERIEFLSPILVPAITKNYLNSSVANMDLSSIKNETASNGLRKEGNEFYKNKCYNEAHTFYTLSIATAPNQSNSLGLAFANRSATLRSMGKLEECLADIDRAFNHGYPELLHFKLFIRQAQCHRDLGQSDQAEQSFRRAETNLKSLNLSNAKKKELEKDLEKEISSKNNEFKEQIHSRSQFILPTLSYGNNNDVPNASNVITVKSNNIHGRYLVASRDIEPGNITMTKL